MICSLSSAITPYDESKVGLEPARSIRRGERGEIADLEDKYYDPKSAHDAEDDPGKYVAYLFAFRVRLGGGSLIATVEERRLAFVHSRLVPPCGNTNKGERSG